MLDGLEQVLRFELLDGDVGVAGHAEGVGLHYIHAREEFGKMCGHHLLQPHEIDLPQRSLVRPPAPE